MQMYLKNIPALIQFEMIELELEVYAFLKRFPSKQVKVRNVDSFRSFKNKKKQKSGVSKWYAISLQSKNMSWSDVIFLIQLTDLSNCEGVILYMINYRVLILTQKCHKMLRNNMHLIFFATVAWVSAP